MRILYVVPKAVFASKMSRVRFQQLDWIAQYLDGRAGVPQVLTTGPGYGDWDDGASMRSRLDRLRRDRDFTVEAVVTYGLPFDHPSLATPDAPVVVQFNEAEDHYATDRAMRSVGASMAVFHHMNDLSHYQHWDAYGIKRVHIPHAADPNVYRDYGLEKDIDVLTCGNMNNAYYPFRYRLMLFATRVLKKRGWRVVHLPHPGYTLPPRDGTVVGEDFARVLNRSKLVFTCSMRYKYQLAKYAEIACSRSLTVADLPDECEPCTLTLNETTVRVEPYMHDDMIQRIVEDLLDDATGLLAKVTTDAYDVAQERLTMRQYASRFVGELTTFIDLDWPQRRHAGDPWR